MPTLTNEMMREIILDHYSNPINKKTPTDESNYQKVHMSSENCIDDIHVYVKEKGGVILDACWDGVACAISTASTDIMCDLVKDMDFNMASKIIENYLNMLYERPYDEEILQEANAFKNTSKQAARIKCAAIGFNGLKEIILNAKKG